MHRRRRRRRRRCRLIKRCARERVRLNVCQRVLRVPVPCARFAQPNEKFGVTKRDPSEDKKGETYDDARELRRRRR